jgi:hypothetical protein
MQATVEEPIAEAVDEERGDATIMEITIMATLSATIPLIPSSITIILVLLCLLWI